MKAEYFKRAGAAGAEVKRGEAESVRDVVRKVLKKHGPMPTTALTEKVLEIRGKGHKSRIKNVLDDLEMHGEVESSWERTEARGWPTWYQVSVWTLKAQD